MFAERLKSLRKSQKITQTEFASRFNIATGTIGMWETGKRIPDTETLKKIANYFNVTVDYLLGDSASDPSPQPGIIRVPVYGVIPAGIPMSAIEEVLDYEEMPSGRDTVGKEFFALKIKGDSMFPNYIDGDVVIFQKQDTCDSGKDCAVMVNGDDATFKRIERKPNGVMLKPLNPAYETMFFTNEEIESKPIRILGVAIEIRRKL